MAELQVDHPGGLTSFKPLGKHDRLTIGSGAGCDVRIDDAEVHPEHCIVGWVSGSGQEGYWLDVADDAEDVTVNGEPSRGQFLAEGDGFQVGPVFCTVVADGVGAAKGGSRSRGRRGAPPPTDEYVTPLLKSKAVIFGVGGLLALCAIGLVLLLWVQERRSQNMFNAALDNYTEGVIDQSIKGFNEFLETFPEGERADNARIWLAFAQVKPLVGGAGDYDQALAKVREMNEQLKDASLSEEQTAERLDLIFRIAEGLARRAGNTRKPDAGALSASKQATQVLADTFRKKDLPADRMAELENLQAEAAAAIKRYDRRVAAVAAMDEALANDRPVEVYGLHQKLYQTYPDMRSDREILGKRDRARAMEQQAVSFARFTPQVPEGVPTGPQPLPPMRSTMRREAAGADPSGQVVPVQVMDALYAVDSGNGEVIWRKASGARPAFSGVKLEGEGDLWLLHLPGQQALVAVDAIGGEEKWRTVIAPFVPRWTTPPLERAGEIYLVGQNEGDPDTGRMLVIESDSGAVGGMYAFPQPLASTPAWDDRRRKLLILAEQASLYSLDPSTRKCDAVMSLDHEADAVRCPPVFASRYVMVVEAQSDAKSVLRCLVLDENAPTAAEKQRIDLPGVAYNPPDLAGGRLFVTTDYNFFAVYDVADEEDEQALTEILRSPRTFEKEGPPTYPAATGENSFWVVGDDYSRHDVDVDDPNAAAVAEGGLPAPASAPPWVSAGNLVVITPSADGRTVMVRGIDAQSNAQRWLVELGVEPMAVDASGDGASLTVIRDGQAETVAAAELDEDAVAVLPFRKQDGPVPPAGDKPTPMRRVPGWTDGVLRYGIGGSFMQYLPEGGGFDLVQTPQPIAGRPAVLGEGVLVPCTVGLYWIDPRTGNELSEPFFGAYSDTRPVPLGPVAVLDDRTVFLAAGPRLIRLTLGEDGGVKSFKPDPNVDVVMDEDRVFDAVGVNGAPLIAYADSLRLLDPKRFRTDTQFELPAPLLRPMQAVGADAKAFVLLTEDDTLLAVTVEGGAIADSWRRKLPRTPAGVLPGADGTVWAVFEDGAVLGFAPADGAQTRSLASARTVVEGPWAVGDRLVVMAADGSLVPVQQ